MHDFPKITFTKEAGAVTTTIRDALAVLPDGTYQMTIEKATRPRSPEQNSRYWAILQIVASYSDDYNANDIHEICKQAFLKQEYLRCKTDKRKRKKVPKTTTKLSTEEFMQYNAKVVQLGIDYFQIDWSKYWI